MFAFIDVSFEKYLMQIMIPVEDSDSSGENFELSFKPTGQIDHKCRLIPREPSWLPI